MLAVVCPGQGAQKPGMLSEWLTLPGNTDVVQEWSRAADLDLVTHGTISSEETITDTAITQPLLTAAALLSYRALGNAGASAEIVAGHSVGEFAAAAIAGVFSEVEAIRLVTARGRAMARCSAATPTGMAAVVGGTSQDVYAAIEEARAYPANINAAGQIVAAGSLEALDALKDNPPAKARVILLKVAGAFHTPYMENARVELAKLAADIRPRDPQRIILSNVDGQPMADGHAVLSRLVSQITNPVHWDQVQSGLRARGVSGLLELAPSGVLLGLARRELKDVARIGLNTPDNLPAAEAFITEHRGEA